MNFIFYLHDEPSTETFERKLLWFKKRYNLVSNKEIEQCLLEGKTLHNACHLTVDDGWLSTYRVIFPVIKKYSIPITIFVSPEIAKTGRNFWYKDYPKYDEQILRSMLVEEGYFSSKLEKYPLDLILKEMNIASVYDLLAVYRKRFHCGIPERGFVNVEELREMSASGLVEIGAHTMSHPILTNETAETALSEIRKSVKQLSELLDKEICTFAYPNGLYDLDFTQRDMEYVRQCGIKTAFSVNPGMLSKATDPLNIPRVGSQKRLQLGRAGLYLPSLHNQAAPRKDIRSFRLK